MFNLSSLRQYKSRGSWKHWNERNKNLDTSGARNIREIIIPTMDTSRYKYLMQICLKHRRPLMFVGPTGTGKSAYVQEKLMRELNHDEFVAYFVNFSAQTSANQTQVRINPINCCCCIFWVEKLEHIELRFDVQKRLDYRTGNIRKLWMNTER